MNNLVEQVARGAFGFLGNRKGEDMMRLQRAESAIEQLDGRHGWKLVPVEPTRTMRNGAVDATGFNWTAPEHTAWRDSPQMLFSAGYKAMLAAAPDPLEDNP